MIVGSSINPNSLRQRVIALEPGQELFVSIDEHTDSAVRHYASHLSFLLGRKYRAKVDRANRGYRIIRDA